MRMWMVPPRMMCQQHLLGEHVETHMLAGTMRKGISLQGYYDNGLVDLKVLAQRHEALAAEMTRRGMNHKSPWTLDVEQWLKDHPQPKHSVPRAASRAELIRRCPDCAALLNRWKKI